MLIYIYILCLVYIFLRYISSSWFNQATSLKQYLRWERHPQPVPAQPFTVAKRCQRWGLRICHTIGFRRHLRHAVHDLVVFRAHQPEQGKNLGGFDSTAEEKKRNLVHSWWLINLNNNWHVSTYLGKFDQLWHIGVQNIMDPCWEYFGLLTIWLAYTIVHNHEHILPQVFPKLRLQLPTLAICNICTDNKHATAHTKKLTCTSCSAPSWRPFKH